MSLKPLLLVGLGNPGPNYADTRHNAGTWLIEDFAQAHAITLTPEKKFLGLYAQCPTAENIRLLIPTTYMNCSGQAISLISKFYKIPPECILVAHDEIDLPAGTVRIKQGGGHGGHNGLRDIISALGTQNFPRIRIGVGHPGDKNKVHDYVLSRPSKSDMQNIEKSIADVLAILPDVLAGKWDFATKELHTAPDK